MKHTSIFPRSGDRGYTKFLIFSYVISALLVLGSTAVWAKSPETAKVAFMSKRDGNAEIYIMNPDGSEQVNLTRHPAADYNPAWAPNGKQILFSSDRDGIFDLYLMDTESTNVRKVFESSKYRWNPTWSPDGKRIAYAQGDPGKAKLQFGLRFVPYADLTLYIATPNGDSVEKLTAGFQPSWSPDGREIAFVVGDLKHTPLGIVNVHTRTHKTLLSKEVPWIFDPTWAPRGNKIAFAKIDGAGFNAQGFISFKKGVLYIANRDGTGLQQVTDENSSSSPTWAPHGKELIYDAFIRGPGGASFQIFKTDLNGHNTTQLTHDGINTSPDWFDPFYSVSPSEQLLTTTWGKIKTD